LDGNSNHKDSKEEEVMTELLKYVEILSANLSAVNLVKDLKEYENMEDFS